MYKIAVRPLRSLSSKLDLKLGRKSVRTTKEKFKESLKEAWLTKQEFMPGASHLLCLGSLDV